MNVLKWAGGKGKLTGAILERFGNDQDYNGDPRWYCEPFFGSGAVFFAAARVRDIDPSRSVIGDSNRRLMGVWADVAGSPTTLIDGVRALDGDGSPEYRRAAYLGARNLFNRQLGGPALMLWLARCSFNGLWRENKSGGMNVPAGTCDWSMDELEKAIMEHHRLMNARLPGPFYSRAPLCCRGSFYDTVEQALSMAKADHESTVQFYFDPPYLYKDGEGFSTYNAGGFPEQMHRDLALLGCELKEKGHSVICSGADNEATRSAYSKWKISSVTTGNLISCDGITRGTRRELIMTPAD